MFDGYDRFQRDQILDRWVRHRAEQLSHVRDAILSWGERKARSVCVLLPDAPGGTLNDLWKEFENNALRGIAFLCLHHVNQYFNIKAPTSKRDRDSVLVIEWIVGNIDADPTVIGLPPMSRTPHRAPLPYNLDDLSFMYRLLWPSWFKPWLRIVEDAMATTIHCSEFAAESKSTAAEVPPDPSKSAKAAQKPRAKRHVVEPQIAAYLERRPLDTAKEVAAEIGCSNGLVKESPGWKANQQRLTAARQMRSDPIGLPLRDYLSSEGALKSTQIQTQKEGVDAKDEEIDAREKELFREIDEYRENHTVATPRKIADALNCHVQDIKRRDDMLKRLKDEQEADEKEAYQQNKPIWSERP